MEILRSEIYACSEPEIMTKNNRLNFPFPCIPFTRCDILSQVKLLHVVKYKKEKYWSPLRTVSFAKCSDGFQMEHMERYKSFFNFIECFPCIFTRM
jgi:hypothetical protein